MTSAVCFPVERRGDWGKPLPDCGSLSRRCWWWGLVVALIFLVQQAQGAQPTRDLQDLRELEGRIRSAVDRGLAATVSVQVRRGQLGGYAFGSGVIVSPEGYVLTAAHVSSRPDQQVEFQLADGRTVHGVTLGLNQDLDMGLLKITDVGIWPHLEIAKSSEHEAGDWCIATGYPGGFEQDGPALVRLGRILKASNKVFLTDCTLVGGDSGGPLINLAGEVIGIHSRIGSDLTTNLHVPVDRFSESWDRLVSRDVWGVMRSFRPWIGVEHDETRRKGVWIKSIRSDSPALRAGIQVGDQIEEFAGEEVSNFGELKEVVSRQEAGSPVRVVVRRGDQRLELDVEVGRRETVHDSQTRDDAELLRDWLDSLDRRRLGGRAIVEIGKNADQVKEAFRDAVTDASRSTVQIKSDGQLVAMGTVIGEGGLILTKASQLGPRLRAGRGRKSFPVVKVSESRRYDLALLKVESADDAANLQAINLKKSSQPAPGELLATVSLNGTPIALSVASSRPISVASQGKLGIVMDKRSDQARVTQIVDDSGAEKAGMQLGDVIESIDGKPIRSSRELISTIAQQYPGDSLRLMVRRNGDLVEMVVTLERMSDYDEALAEFEDFIGGSLSRRRTGFDRVLPHDAPLLPHQCGGPVVDTHGRFVGINIARAARTNSSLLPADEVTRAIRDLLAQRSDQVQTIGVGAP